jgi:glycosyltransferase involved in cell wall biosynthesis
VSVLLPVYNGERYVGAAVRSIVEQTYRNIEVLVLDDGSTDASALAVERMVDPRVRLLRFTHRGLSSVLNEGLAAARGELIARQDADDWSEPRRLERQVAALDARPELALIGCQAWLVSPAGTVIGTVDRCLEPLTVRWYSLLDNPFIHTAVMFRAAVVRDELGGYDPAFDPYSQDLALWSKLLDRYPAANLAERLVRYRASAESIIGAVDADPDGTYAKRFDSMLRQLIAGTLIRVFGDDLSESERGLLAGFGVAVDSASVSGFLAAFHHLLQLFISRHPEITASTDFWRVVARQFDAIAFRLSPPSRRAALQVYSACARRTPRAAAHLSWPRAVTQVVFGKSARQWMTRTRRSAARAAMIGSL